MRWTTRGGETKPAGAPWYTVLLLVVLLQTNGCSSSHNVGIIAGLTGSHSELGVAGRNGALFRFEEENARRGMNRFVLSMEDDQNDPERVPGIVERFRKAGVSVVIGPFTSTIAMAVINEQPDLLFVSPTASAKRLAGLDDMLVRLMGSVDEAARNLAREMKQRHSLTSAAVVWDSTNNIYAEDYLAAFTDGWGAEAGWWQKDVPGSDGAKEVLIGRAFDASSNDEVHAAGCFLAGSSADSVLIIASGSNAASIIRMLRRDDFKGLIMVAGWAITSDLSVWGTDTLEGVVFSQQYDPAFSSPRFVEFQNNYLDRFGSEPSFGAIFAYEAADLVIRAMNQGFRENAIGLRKSIFALDPFEALQGSLHLDSFGDPVRGVFLFQFHSGSPVRIE